jgi:hypothetical protein
MANFNKTRENSDVDKGLVSMFLKMSPEERLKDNDNAVCTILELRNAYKQQKAQNNRPERNTCRSC